MQSFTFILECSWMATQKDLYLGLLSSDSKILTTVITLEKVKGHWKIFKPKVNTDSCEFIISMCSYVWWGVCFNEATVAGLLGSRNEGTNVIPAAFQPGSLHWEHSSVTALTRKWVYPCNSSNCFSIFSTNRVWKLYIKAGENSQGKESIYRSAYETVYHSHFPSPRKGK